MTTSSVSVHVYIFERLQCDSFSTYDEAHLWLLPTVRHIVGKSEEFTHLKNCIIDGVCYNLPLLERILSHSNFSLNLLFVPPFLVVNTTYYIYIYINIV